MSFLRITIHTPPEPNGIELNCMLTIKIVVITPSTVAPYLPPIIVAAIVFVEKRVRPKGGFKRSTHGQLRRVPYA